MELPAKEAKNNIILSIKKNMKMKFTNKKILFAVTALFIIALIPFIQSCSSNNEFDDTEKIQNNVELTASEKNEIINSTEFKEFVDANIEIAALVKSLKSAQQNSSKVKSKLEEVVNNGKSNKASTFDYDYDKFKLNIEKIKAFSEKFPTLKQNNQNEMRSLMIESVSKSKELQQKMIAKGLISLKQKNTRQKTNAENTFSMSPAEAYMCVDYIAYIYQVECAGFVLADGTAVVYLDPSNTRDNSSYPKFYWGYLGGVVGFYYDGQQVTETIHVHFNSFNYSTKDQLAQELCFPNATMTIFYHHRPYTYNYVNGETHDYYGNLINP